MSTTQEHIKAARGLLRGFQGLQAAAEALEAVGSAEERLHSLTVETAKAVEARNTAEAAAKVALDNLAEVANQVEAARAERIQVRDGMVADAEREAAGIRDAARTEADQIVAAAKEKAKTASEKAKATDERAEEVLQVILVKQAELAALESAIAEIRSKLLG